MKQSWSYQLAIENNIPYYLRDFGSIIVQSPTGSGKSHIINKTVQRINAAGKTALVLSDAKKIHVQLLKECSGYPITSNIKYMHILPGHCYVAMTQTLQNRTSILDQFKELNSRGELVMIIDECHIGTMNNVIDEIKCKFMVAFSATPHYRWAKHLPRYYKGFIHGPQISELIRDGHLSHYSHVSRTGADLTQLKLNAKGEFSEESQNQVFGGKKMYDGLFEDLPLYKKFKTVIYVASIHLCEQVYKECLERGYRACRYHSGSQLQDAEWELGKFTERNEADVCVSVSSLTKGWDYPPIDLVVLWRATGSLPLYLQMCGRGGRPCSAERALEEFSLPNYEKKYFTVLDYGGNFERFGGWAMDRDWTTLWQEPPKRRTTSTYLGVGGSKECPVCKVLLPIAARSCDNCGYIYPTEEMKLVEGKLVEVQNTMNAMTGKVLSDLTAEELALYARAKDKKQHAIRVAKRMEQEQPGFIYQFAKAMGYQRSWADRVVEELMDTENKIPFFNSYVKF